MLAPCLRMMPAGYNMLKHTLYQEKHYMLAPCLRMMPEGYNMLKHMCPAGVD
jgi:hypothetical protein